mmetsp:Transcript_106854/g.212179  ORF Transcript_106854/g.212179 Transcript_106854/m.212179 type:complete len:117 (-) Transcript_106854:271-621(-)|eukprot:CAMPEP_0172724782 /NCGR_PEP_ID=MMETSP1074-20121228/86862_1 /TAXON_ID=2916 /ORGANISM="Ceratium fusus, Strain PA161109" /LENGTH=116 /DNA_ID=CAMNT_0013551355 /DNA_START=57 /DNA_END=407 /DNA_ORIENTATION=+
MGSTASADVHIADGTLSSPRALASQDAYSDETPRADHSPSFINGGMSVADFRWHYVDPVLLERQNSYSDETPRVDHSPSFIDGGMSMADFRRHYVDPLRVERQAAMWQVARTKGGA